jgi:hypothetical protein
VSGVDLDPFGERALFAHRRHLRVLAADIEFESNDPRLMRLVDRAYAHLPPHRWERAPDRLRITLRIAPGAQRPRRATPPRAALSSGAGGLIATIDAANFVVINTAARCALVQVSSDMLAHEYHVRYELIELAALTLATRVQALLPLHAACIGARGRGVLVLGDSGAGKSTLSLCSALDGLQLLSEDSVFVEPRALRATGAANFIYVQRGVLRHVASAATRARIRRSPQIRRRSGARKFQVDLRTLRVPLAARPLGIAATVILSARRTNTDSLLTPLAPERFARMLRTLQPHAGVHREWPAFERRLLERGGFELARGRDPLEGVHALRVLLAR